MENGQAEQRSLCDGVEPMSFLLVPPVWLCYYLFGLLKEGIVIEERVLIHALIGLTRVRKLEWRDSANKETYATANSNQTLTFQGHRVEIAVLCDPINDWKPVVVVTQELPCPVGSYMQELFRTTYDARTLMAAIDQAWHKDSREALRKRVPDGELVNLSQEVSEQAATELMAQFRKM
ncbi:MAG: hypothetical protein Q8L24_00470 [bacterium]|nr:hypothetical protein [bacterium]